MRTFTSGFASAKNKTSSRPVNLLKIDWPAFNVFPARTVRLADRPMTVGAETWTPTVADWGRIEPDADAGVTFGAGTRLTVLNTPADYGKGLERFSDLLEVYAPEAATVTLYQWFDDEGLSDADLTELLTGRLVDPIEFDEAECRFHLAPVTRYVGRTPVGTGITLGDYPNAPDRSVGRIRPIVIGTVERVPGIRVRKVSRTLLVSVAAPGTTSLDVKSTEGFPIAGTLMLNDDTVTYSGINATQFTGCSGVNDFHYADDEVLESVTDHRFLFSDPAYPIASLDNVQVAGVAADPADYVVDLAQGEVVFQNTPRRVESIDTRFLQAQFDVVASGNTAIDPLNATDPNGRTRYAQISQVNPTLKLQQTDTMAALGQISKVFLRVEHFVEEKLPNDSISVAFEGVGSVGVLSPPADADEALTTGNTDITHTHLDTFGFPVNDPNHLHTATSEADHVLIQGASSGPAGNLKVTGPADVGPYTVPINFPSAPAGVLKAEYRIIWRFRNITFSTGSPIVKIGNNIIGTFNSSRSDFDYTQTFTVNGSAGGDTWSITLNTGALFFDVQTAERTLFYGPNPATLANPLDTVKSGSVDQHGSSPTLSATTEKATRTVVDFFDISALVNRDWNWFLNRIVEISYTGTVDGRTAYVLHVAFEIEYARRRLAATDAVTADVNGVIDDAGGSITGVPGSLIMRPDHVFLWSLEILGGVTETAIDTASFSIAGSALDAAVNGGYRISGVVADKTRLDALWRDWMRETRTDLYWDSAGRVRLAFRPMNRSSEVTGQEVKALADNMIRRDAKTGQGRIHFQRTPSEEIINHIELQYLRDWAEGHYAGLHVASDTVGVARYGKRERPEKFKFDWCRSADQAADLAAFYLAESATPQTLVECEVFPEHLELERGDVVTLTHALTNGNNLLALVLPGVHQPGSGRNGVMDTLNLRLRLFPIEYFQELITAGVAVTDAWVSTAVYQQKFAQTVAVSDSGLLDEIDGWGVQEWGTSGWGGKVPL